MYQHILLTTDLTASSNKVIARAQELAQVCHAKLSVVHVVEFVPNAYSGGELTLAPGIDVTEVFAKNAHEELTKLAKQLHIDAADCYVVVNSIKYAVIDLATKIKADLIIVGSHGKHGVQLLLGSGANAILHAAKCDVLAVRV